MAVTPARSEDSVRKIAYDAARGTGRVDVKHGASGGSAPEGYGLGNLLHTIGSGGSGHVPNEGVSVRGAEEDEKRFKEADKFMKSKAEFDKKLQNPEALAKALEEEKKEHQKEAEKKPTAAGLNVGAVNSGVGTQSASATQKQEVAEEKAKQAEKPQPPSDKK